MAIDDAVVPDCDHDAEKVTPSLSRRRVGAQLRRWRELMGVSSGDAAAFMGWSQARYSRTERGYYRISSDQVSALCKFLGIDDPEGVKEVGRVADQPIGTGWWAPHAKDGTINSAYLDFVELENEAETIRSVHPKVVAGLVQSPGYVREMQSSARSSSPESMIALRLARQHVLSRAKFHGIIPETAFLADFKSDPNLMKDQLRKLLDVSQMDNVTLQILPAAAHPAYASNGAITIFTFHHPWTSVASIDNPMGGSHTFEHDQVAFLEAEFDDIASAALPVDTSRDLINQYLEGLHQ
ncbi:helix-turn-helix transcriptional regulator [Streptomyces sp. NPDC048717]|uniref:helix-turn-helix domain-containing protein n=1 Tax=Streptomyces sp. NPDC048717 TaxID=3154928 RepID=UPI003449027D